MLNASFELLGVLHLPHGTAANLSGFYPERGKIMWLAAGTLCRGTIQGILAKRSVTAKYAISIFVLNPERCEAYLCCMVKALFFALS
jgi:hypothetical protein